MPLQTPSRTDSPTFAEGLLCEPSPSRAPAGRTAQLCSSWGRLRCRSLPCLCSALEHGSCSWQEAIREASAGLVAKGALPTCTDREGEGFFGNPQMAAALFLPQCQAGTVQGYELASSSPAFL